MIKQPQLPVGQRVRADFPRFGMPQFGDFNLPDAESYQLMIVTDEGSTPVSLERLNRLERVEQVCDFHCVTTWSYCGLRWSGFRLWDVFVGFVPNHLKITSVILKGMDKFKSILPLEDALADDVLIVDQLNDEPLNFEHGAPLRIIAPAHYGYKSIKHLQKIEFWQNPRYQKPLLARWMEHPRARVEFEERGQIFPGWFLRLAYRLLIKPTIQQLKRD